MTIDGWNARETAMSAARPTDVVRLERRVADLESQVQDLRDEPPPATWESPAPLYAFSLYSSADASGGDPVLRLYQAEDADGNPMPLVVVDGEPVDVDGLDELPEKADPLRLVVERKDGVVSARLYAEDDTGSDDAGSDDAEVLADIPIVSYGLESSLTFQHHVGVVALTSSSVQPGNPCRVDSIDDATCPIIPTGMEDTGEVITVNYTKAGDDCEDGTNSFTIPILRSSGGGGDFSMDVTDEDVAGTADHPNGGVKVTLSPSRGQADDFTVWNGKDGGNGKDAVVNVAQAANGATDVHKNGGTKVTLTPNNGGAAATFDVWNGNDGPAGSDGRSIVSASSGDPSQDGDYTVTPVTFVDNAGKMIGPVDVKAKNGEGRTPLTGSITFVTRISWDSDNHTIVAEKSTLDLVSGLITPEQSDIIETVRHSDVIGDGN